jgi:hypothetical protein
MKNNISMIIERGKRMNRKMFFRSILLTAMLFAFCSESFAENRGALKVFTGDQQEGNDPLSVFQKRNGKEVSDDGEHGDGRKIKPEDPYDIMRPASPKQKMRPASPKQNMRPASPKQNMRPASPAGSLRPAAPGQSLRPSGAHQIIRPASPMQNMRPASPHK